MELDKSVLKNLTVGGLRDILSNYPQDLPLKLGVWVEDTNSDSYMDLSDYEPKIFSKLG